MTSPGSRVGARRLFDAGSALRWKASLHCWFRDVTAFIKSWIRLDGLSQPMLRRESSGPASGSSLRELESDEGEKQERMNTALAPCFKQSDLDSPTGGCSNQSVRVGQSPACTASLAKYTSSDITSYMIINLLSHVHSFIIVTKSAV